MVKHYLLLCFFSLTLCGAARASETSISLGGFYSQSDSSIQVSDPVQDSQYTLDYESDLQLAENQFLPFVALNHHFNERHNFYFDWKQLHRDADTSGLAQPFQVEIDDTVYEVNAGARLHTTLNIDIATLGYGYDFLQGTNYNVGASVGLHTMFIKAGFEGTIGACASSDLVNNLCGSHAMPSIIEEHVTAPLPDFGLYANYEFLPGWQFNAQAQYFYVKLDDMQGRLVDVKLGVEAEIAKNWHMSVAYNYYQIDVELDQQRPDAEVNIANYNLNYSFTGPMVSLSYRF
ncbi:hypothetical protein [Shewanella salipaludis]|uniref:Outer membrane protein beta-barrel domain-containing protein n=1 Tax=Shewanella salipaludis TaxID=2723052 RepID=A0A972FY58_9GAMM|nr:hypothetical protein [Shewanella salipaludis]NMH63704.1 hypothetical protein [Shewanella salipaludis]